MHIELHVPICQVDEVYKGESKDYITVNTPNGDKLKFSVEKNKFDDVLGWGKKVSIKSNVVFRMYQNQLSMALDKPLVKEVKAD